MIHESGIRMFTLGVSEYQKFLHVSSKLAVGVVRDHGRRENASMASRVYLLDSLRHPSGSDVLDCPSAEKMASFVQVLPETVARTSGPP